MSKNMDALGQELSRMLGIAGSLNLDKTIAEMGWDSMMLVELAIATETVYEKRVKLSELGLDFTVTLRQMLAAIDAQLEGVESSDAY